MRLDCYAPKYDRGTSTMHLKELQQDFINAIFEKNNVSAAKHVSGDERLSAEQRLGIYRGSVHGILTNTLGITFPVTKALVGETFFDQMCDSFIDQYPPKSPFFAKYGGDFSKFLEQFEPAKSINYLADVSGLEWARHAVWHENLSEPVDFSEIANLTEEQQSTVWFELKQSLRLIESKYRIDLIWFAHQDESNIKLEDMIIDEDVKLLIWKGIDGIKITQLEENDKEYWNFLQAISKQNSITQLAEKFGEQLPSHLNRCIQEGWIQSFNIS